MKIAEKTILTEKQQKYQHYICKKYDIKYDKYEYLTGGEILPSNQRQIIEQAKFAYSPLGKGFLKKLKTSEDQQEKQIGAITNQNKRPSDSNQ